MLSHPLVAVAECENTTGGHVGRETKFTVSVLGYLACSGRYVFFVCVFKHKIELVFTI